MRLHNLLLSFGVVSLAVLFTSGQTQQTIAAIQGDNNASSFDRMRVRTSGVVTGRTSSGFFLQTPDDKIDANPNTSEGIFVFTKGEPPVQAQVGNLVTITGLVSEFRPRQETTTLFITEISFFLNTDKIQVDAKNVPLPKAIVLTADDFRRNSVDQLERYEGMRVSLPEMTVVGPTGGRVDHKNETVVSDGVFFGVLKGVKRPFREAGVDVHKILLTEAGEKEKKQLPKLPVWDSNPEVIRVDSDGLVGSTLLDVPALVQLQNITGVLHYGRGKFTIMPDPTEKIGVSTTTRPVVFPQPTDRQFTVAAMNIETLVDDVDDPDIKEDVATTPAFQKRLTKISRAIRELMRLPDVIGVIEAENINVLKRVAQKLNEDEVAAGRPDPKYDAFLFNGNDGRGIDCGFLVKTARVNVIATKQIGKSDRYRNPVTKNDDILNDRPPILLEASITDAKTSQPVRFAVLASHLKSYLGIDDEKEGPNVRMKKKLQAEFLAKFAAERLKADPSERLLLIGDFNAYQFSDGIVDVVGTIKGSPAPKDAVLNPSEVLVEPNLINFVDLITADQRYSYIYDGSAQTLDHFIASPAFRAHLAGFGFLRANADFPQSWRADGNRPERFSDHDPAIAYFNLEAKP